MSGYGKYKPQHEVWRVCSPWHMRNVWADVYVNKLGQWSVKLGDKPYRRGLTYEQILKYVPGWPPEVKGPPFREADVPRTTYRPSRPPSQRKLAWDKAVDVVRKSAMRRRPIELAERPSAEAFRDAIGGNLIVGGPTPDPDTNPHPSRITSGNYSATAAYYAGRRKMPCEDDDDETDCR